MITAVGAGCSSGPEHPGDSCEITNDHCPDGLVCGPDGAGDPICQVPIGGACDPAADDGFCAGGTACFADPGAAEAGAGICALPSGVACDPAADGTQCGPGLTCAEVDGGDHANVCFVPVVIQGRVFDSGTTEGIAGAHVIAIDDRGTPITDVSVTVEDGTYQLAIPLVRDPDGKPLAATFTLRASAADYQTFPGGLRTALPQSTSDAVEQTEAWVIDTPITDIALIALPAEEQGHGTISGTVVSAVESAGVLVVAESEGIGYSALSDAAGSYTIFNVPDAAYTVRGYAAGVQLTPVDVTVDGADVTDVDLIDLDAPLATISGSINIVNAPAASATSVVLVVESTFSETFARGDVPRGLRTPLVGEPTVTGAWTIPDVPEGVYVVLAAFENDQLVRDPDTNIAGTQILHLTVPDATGGTDITVDTAFKVTEALPIVGPGIDQPEAVAATPELSWGDDSSEEYYSVVVFDAFGNLVWEDPAVPSVSGSDTVTVTYGGPALEPGLYYQFRATSWRAPGGGTPSPISTTEDLRGVFFLQP